MDADLMNAMEFGFKTHEKGWNLEKAREEFEKILKGGTKNGYE